MSGKERILSTLVVTTKDSDCSIVKPVTGSI